MQYDIITIEQHAEIVATMPDATTSTTPRGGSTVTKGHRDGETPTILIQLGTTDEAILIDDGTYARFLPG